MEEIESSNMLKYALENKMIISDEDIAHVLSILKKRGSDQNSRFTATIEKELKHNQSGHFRQKVTDKKYVKYDKDNDTIKVSVKGCIFLTIFRFNNFFKKYGNIIIIVLTLIIIGLMLYLDKNN